MTERNWNLFASPSVETCHRLGDGIAGCRCTRHLRPVQRNMSSVLLHNRDKFYTLLTENESRSFKSYYRPREKFAKALKSWLFAHSYFCMHLCIITCFISVPFVDTGYLVEQIWKGSFSKENFLKNYHLLWIFRI